MKATFLLLTISLGFVLNCDFFNSVDSSGETHDKLDTLKIDIEKTVDSLAALVNVCGTSDLKELADMDAFSDKCEEQLLKFLPESQNTVTDRLFPLGSGIIDDGLVLFCSGTGSAASALADSAAALKLYRYDDGVQSLIDTARYTRKKIENFDGTLISLSTICDYSGSMSNGDINDGIEIFTDLFSVATLTDRFETEIILFSDSVLTRMEFSSDGDSIARYIARDDDFERGSTSLFDALGTGFNHLSERTSPVRLIIVSTDGKENNSSTYESEEELYELSRQHHLPVIILGSLLADLDFMKEVARETGGAYIYSRTILELKQKAVEIGHLFENAVGIVLDSATTASPPDSLVLKSDGQRIVFPSLP